MFLDTFKQQFEPRIKLFLETKDSSAKALGEAGERAILWLKEFALAPGKRSRPTLVVVGNQISGGKLDEDVFNLALAMELFHDFALIHDDVMDKACLRRGVPTVHKMAEEFAADADFGVSSAILVGDLAYIYSDEMFEKALAKGRFKKTREVFLRLREEVTLGQQLDLELGLRRTFPTPKEVLKLMEWKTARYTIIGPLELGFSFGLEKNGADLASADNKKNRQLIHKFGRSLGIAFQIHDDLEGTFGDVKVAGKPTDSDIKEGKVGLFLAKTYQLSGEQKKIDRIVGNREITEKEFNWLKDEIDRLGGRQYAISYADNLLTEAKVILTNSNWPETGKAVLEEMILAIEKKLANYQ